MANFKCAICGRWTNCICEDDHFRVWLCPPEERDCFLVHRQDRHGEPFEYPVTAHG